MKTRTSNFLASSELKHQFPSIEQARAANSWIFRHRASSNIKISKRTYKWASSRSMFVQSIPKNNLFDLTNLYLQRSINLLSSCDYIAPFVSYLLNGFVHWKYKSINKIYTWKESSGFKNFPGHIFSGFRFCLKMHIFPDFFKAIN